MMCSVSNLVTSSSNLLLETKRYCGKRKEILHLIIDKTSLRRRILREEEESFLYVFVPANIKVIFCRNITCQNTEMRQAGQGGWGGGRVGRYWEW